MEIRQSFLDFFLNKKHEIVTSAPLLPESPNLLFTNAGMNQFVPFFLGDQQAPFPRASDTQKCIRAGGKHNDLEDVGFDTYHHTFFEMLGNWSFGDYFKKEAIEWSWELLTEVWKFPPERLYATVYKPGEGEPANFDQEAHDIWTRIFEKAGLDPKIHLVNGDKKDNFWMMGETGPCGPCSELHVDLTPEGDTQGSLINKDSPWCIEIWNLVFIQLNAAVDGTYQALPARHVDTGMGFERIAGIMATTQQFTDFSNPPSNYNSDLFKAIFEAIESMCSHKYGYTMPESRTFKNETESNDCAFRVIADHIRTLSFSIADGIIPSNEGRNYVLRRILRRAILFGRKLNLPSGFFTELSKTLIKQMGTAYPELVDQKTTIEKVIANEESAFNKTLERGLQLFDKMSAKGSITGEEAFSLYDTYGFPFDLTALIAEERKLSIDKSGFDSCMNQQKERARSSQKKEVVLTAEDSNLTKTDFKGFDLNSEVFSAEIISIESVDENTSAIILDQTIFYSEMGGQIGDTGTLTTNDGTAYSVIDTQVKNGIYLHLVETQETLKGTVSLNINLERRQAIQRHHSATHLLNWALRSTLGTHIQQAGSSVTENRLRFDFSHFEAIDSKTLQAIEQSINEKVMKNSFVETYEVAYKDKPEDVVAVFGEKYGDQVRVVDIGGFSKELCGGTHVQATGEIGLVKIISESGIAAGTRRIEAICGETAYTLAEERFTQVDALANKFNCNSEELANRVDALIDSKKQLEKELKRFHQKALSEQVDKLAESVEIIGDKVSYLHSCVIVSDSNDLRNLGNQILSKLDSGLVVLASNTNGKTQICAALSQEAVAQGYNAGSIVKEICETLGGRGGGKANFAMGGAPENKSLAKVIKNYTPKTA